MTSVLPSTKPSEIYPSSSSPQHSVSPPSSSRSPPKHLSLDKDNVQPTLLVTHPSTDSLPPARPPPRPTVRKSNLDLEQNPFEMSFSATSNPSEHSANSAGSNNSQKQNSSDPPPRSGSPSAGGGSRRNSIDPAAGAQSKSSVSPKPVLPPLSSIAEAAEGNGFPWGSYSDLAGSLRSGPLSPAMLAGPRGQGPLGGNAAATVAAQHSLHHLGGPGHLGQLTFDPSSSFVRTGLTPDVGRTGLTPLVGGPASFPPPSPNTAAFLAMVTNNAAGANSLTGGATITPNTLSALTGVVIGTASNTNGSASDSQHHPHPLSISHVAQYPNSHQSNQQQNFGPGGNNNDPSAYPPGEFASSARNATNAAANGLFLLSQAHQELTKREEEQQAQAAAAAAQQTTNTRGAAKRAASNTNGHTKRKSVDVPATKPPPGKRARGSTNTVAPTPTRVAARRKSTIEDFGSDDEDSFDGQDMEDDDAMSPGGSNKNKRPETEEEKRKNFLERNRQGELIVRCLVFARLTPYFSCAQMSSTKEGLAYIASTESGVLDRRE